MLAPQRILLSACALVLCLMTPPAASAEWRWCCFGKECDDSPLARYERAGRPQEISHLARTSESPKDDGYYVGGGAPHRGDSRFGGDVRYCDEGTWGWDYAPGYSKVKLWWYHGRRYQGGEGQYEPDKRNNPFEHLFDD